MKTLSAIVLLTLGVVQIAQAKGFYTIISPPVVRSNSQYLISIETTGLTETLNLTLGIFNEPANYTNFIDVSVLPNSMQTTQLQLGDLSSLSGYKFRVVGSGAADFIEEAWLGYNAKSYSIMAQTDKTVYKPGDFVKFRVMVVDENLKPLKLIKTLSVFIEGPRGKRVKQWTNIGGTLKNNVFSDRFKLPNAPSLGEWALNVQYGNDIQFLKFDVDQSVIPKIEVIISAPIRNTFKSGKFVFNVATKYAYGQPAVGLANLQARKVYGFMSKKPGSFYKKTVPISSQTMVEYDIEQTFGDRNTSINTAWINVEAGVKDEVTGTTYTGKATIPIYDDDFIDLRISEYDTNFKPGLPYSFTVQVLKLDGKPVIDTVNPINVTTYYGWDDNDRNVMQVKMDKDGRAVVTMTAPLSADVLDFQISYLDYTNFLYLPAYASDSWSFVGTSLEKKTLEVREVVKVNVQATENMQYLYFHVIGRGNVLISKTIRVMNKKTASFKFTSTFDMMPNSKLLVFYYRSNGEIVSDVRSLKFNRKLDNFLNIKIKNNDLTPGKTLNLSYESKCNSFVGVWGIDQNSLFLSSATEKGLNPLREIARGPQGAQGPQGSSGSKVFAIIGPETTAEEELNKVVYSGEASKLDRDSAFSEITKFDLKAGSFPSPKSQSIRPHDLAHEVAFIRLIDAGTLIFTNSKKYKLSRHIYSVGNSDAGSPGGTGGAGGAGGVGSAVVAFVPTVIRNHFPETWIWDDSVTSTPTGQDKSMCKTTVSIKVPDILSAWTIRGFTLNDKNGIGFGESDEKLKVTEPISVTTTIPFSVKRGEVLTVSAEVFNSMATEKTVSVTLFYYDSFDYVVGVDDKSFIKHKNSRTMTYNIKPESGQTVKFVISPKKLGYATIKIIAQVNKATYGSTVQQILILADGTTIYIDQSIILDLRKSETFNTNVKIDIPSTAIAGSIKTEIKMFVNVLVPTITNIESLTRLPTGCGEQNMLAMVPTIAVLEFMLASNVQNHATEKKLKAYLEAGYVNELNFQRFDGSFSPFGESDASGSTWLTAFVAKGFLDAKKFIFTDDKVIEAAILWLIAKQTTDGEFKEPGRSLHSAMQSEATGGVALTAYVMMTLLSVPGGKETFKDNLDTATGFINSKLESISDMYTLAIATHALQLIGDKTAVSYLKKLNAGAIKQNSMMWWGQGQKTSSIDVENTAYGLLVNMHSKKDTNTFLIMKWLINERTDKGGFRATQDTVVAVQALAKLATKNGNADTQMDVILNDGKITQTLKIDNALQTTNELSPDIQNVEISASGKGFAIAQVSYKYNVKPSEPQPQFKLDLSLNPIPSERYLSVRVCVNYIENDWSSASNMALMEVAFPSGYTFDPDSMNRIVAIDVVKKVELKQGDTVAVIYFEYLDSKVVCLNAEAFQTNMVNNTNSGVVTVYDYYDGNRRAVSTYEVPNKVIEG